MSIDDRTTNRSYKLPNVGNFLADDVVRLRDALAAIDADIYARYTKLEVDQLITNLINGAPGALDTLNELAEALGDDANFAATVASQLALKADASNVYSKAESDARYVQGSTQAEMVFIATANQSVFTLTTAVINKPSALVTVDGVVQPTSEYSLNMTGTQLTLSEGVPAGTVVRVLALGVASQGAPADDTVTTPKLRDGAVTNEKLAGVIAPTVSSINGGPISGARNRIINGDMRIDQRNAGAAVTPNTGQYLVDRWRAQLSQASKYSAQRNAGAVTPPAGFTNYLGATSLSAYTLAGNDQFSIEQVIEGFNIADLDWGTANAKPAVLSFWVRSSLTGTFGGSIATTKTAVWVMPFTYSIASANTWTYVTVSIPAATSTGGTNNDNTEGVYVRFGLGSTGAGAGGTAGTWTSAGNYIQPSGTVSVVGTNGATFYITGVQLEAGSVATPFERRDIGRELMMCQRYYEKLQSTRIYGSNANLSYTTWFFKVVKRATPTITLAAGSVGTLENTSTDATQAYTNGYAEIRGGSTAATEL